LHEIIGEKIVMNYDVIQPNNVLRTFAGEQLRGVWGKMAFAFFAVFLIYMPLYISAVLSQLHPEAAVFAIMYGALSVIYAAIAGPFYLGFAGYLLKRTRGEDVYTKNIFDGFKHFSRSFVLMLLTYLFTFLWALLLIIPGIIKSLSYSMAFFILYDNPEMKPHQALQESCRMMKGYRSKLFCLVLSFAGWYALGLLTLGIAYFWLGPYVYMSIANFYENLKTTGRDKPYGNAD
jgi:uncharacterized membrane protein